MFTGIRCLSIVPKYDVKEDRTDSEKKDDENKDEGGWVRLEDGPSVYTNEQTSHFKPRPAMENPTIQEEGGRNCTWNGKQGNDREGRRISGASR